MAKETSETLKKICDGRVRLQRRNGNPMIYARAYIQGKDVVFRTGQDGIKLAEEAATDWWLELRGKAKRNEHVHGRLFADVADAFIKHAETHLRGEISDGQIEQYAIKWAVLKPHFQDVLVTNIDTKFLVDLREVRSKVTTQFGRPVSPSTLKKDLDLVRMVLRHAKDAEKCIDHLPTFPKFQGHRFTVAKRPTPYLTLKQYNTLVAAAQKHAAEPGINPRTRRQREELLCFIQICTCAALRVGEAYSIRWMDCTPVRLTNGTKHKAIRMMVKGKHFKWTGAREEAYALYQGVTGFEMLRKARPDAKPEDSLFLEEHKDGVTALLEKCKLRVVKDNESDVPRLRTSKSFRHSGISLWLKMSKDPNIVDIAKWARTSTEQVRHFYDQNPVRSSVERIATWEADPNA